VPSLLFAACFSSQTHHELIMNFMHCTAYRPCRLSELAEPYWVLKNAGYDITLASPNGGAVPVDPASLAGDFKTADAERMLNDGELLFCGNIRVRCVLC
jgi:putative intracellular protease/amidase